MKLKVKKLSDKAVVPTYSDSGCAGLDLTATSEKIVFDGTISYIEYGTSLAFEIPVGYFGLLVPRSSVSSNTSLLLANSCGILDESYRGEVKFRYKSIVPIGGKKYKVGDRIGQLIVLPYPKIDVQFVDDLTSTERSDKGFGSTGL